MGRVGGGEEWTGGSLQRVGGRSGQVVHCRGWGGGVAIAEGGGEEWPLQRVGGRSGHCRGWGGGVDRWFIANAMAI